jgi:hypothetical protein
VILLGKMLRTKLGRLGSPKSEAHPVGNEATS